MTVAIPALPAPVPQSTDPINFDARADAFLGALPATADAMNAQNAENNTLNANVNTKAAQVALDRTATGEDRVQTGLDRTATGADRVQTGQDRTAAAASTTTASAASAAATTAANNAVAVVTGGTASLLAAPGRIPIADAAGRIHTSWFQGALGSALINHIGTPNAAGFGVGICPQVPASFTPLPGCTDPASANYGNYQHIDGSVMCWIPAFRFRLGNAADPGFATYGANTIRIVPAIQHPDEATANAEGYYLHRAFINGGVQQPGFFRDKYDCSANGGVASSIANAMPMVSGPGAGQTGFSAVGAANAYHGSFVAARTRGAKFHPETIFQADALTRISEAHAQAATATTHCAWYDATGVRNYPKGNDNSALKSEADVLQNGAGAVTWATAGAGAAAAFALTGSAVPFARSTHNGQACGVADVAGNIYKINPGMTSIATSASITAATTTSPVQITVTAHGRTTGDVVLISGVAGMTQLNNRMFTVTVVDANTLGLAGTDGTAFTPYASGGSITRARFFALKAAADITAITPGNTLTTDHWGANGVAANFDEIAMAFATTYPNNVLGMRYGNGASAVFSLATAADRARTMLGMPAPGGVNTAGSNLMGADWFHQFALDQLCVLSRGYWNTGSDAGSRFRYLANSRANAYHGVGFAASCYL